MIPDDIKDDEVFEDDFDIDDFDEDWDDQGDIAEDSINDTAIASDEPSPDKTFLQKFFIPIVVGVVVIFAGIFIAGQGMFSSGTPAPDNIDGSTPIEENTATNQTEGFNPQKDDTSLTEDEDILLSAPAQNPPDIIEDTPLRPLPSEASNDQIELADLDAELQSDDEPTSDSEAFDFINDDTSQPEPDVAVETLFDDAPEFLSNEQESDTVDNSDVADMSVENAIEEPASSDETLLFDESMDETPTMSPTSPDMSGNLEALDDQVSVLETENQALTKDVDNSRETIDALNDEIAALKAEIKEMESIRESATKPVEAQTPAPKPAKKASPVAYPKPAPKTSVIWSLKSAQPGKASISADGSRDLKAIEVGSVVSGIGRVTSIDIENGKWIVRGTKGNISQ